ncbi:MAG: type II CRISPR RNA-guided endonuclease Cas9 [Patescibacteria group bacterium]
MSQKNLIYTLGLDIGIGSVGWAVVENRHDEAQNRYVPYRLVDTGVRLFDVAEVPKTGESPTKARRLARSNRKRLHRRKVRLQTTKKILLSYGIIKSINDINEQYSKGADLYKLRVEALDKLITDAELSICVLQLIKRRGFKSSRKNIDLDNGGEYKDVLNANTQRLQDNGYRTVGEMLYKDSVFEKRKRNTTESYIAMCQRKDLGDELRKILIQQQFFGNNKINSELIKEILETFNEQRSFSDPEVLQKMVGKCTLEPNEYRAPRNSITFEKFQLLQSLRNLKLYEKSAGREEFSLDDADIKKIFDKGFEHSKLTYAHIRKILSLPETTRYSRFKYKYAKLTGNKLSPEDVKIENTKFFEPKGYKAIEKAFSGYIIWNDLKNNDDILDTVAEALTYNKTEDDIQKFLKGKGVDQEIIDVCAKIKTFSKFAHLSITALRKITPHLFKMTYDKACEEAGYDFRGKVAKKFNMMPRILTTDPGSNDSKNPYIIGDIRSPVVMRALSQTRKVINAIISKYGQPAYVNIELSRDMSKSRKDRQILQKQIEANESERNAVIERLKSEFGIDFPTGGDILKYRLYTEQGYTCAYSLKTIPIDALFDNNRTQIDHILPYSRSLNDSYSNKALVLVEENQEKRNFTPIEYIRNKYGKDSQHEKKFRLWVEERFSSDKLKKKRANFLEENLPDIELQSFIDRDLNDTRYVSREIKNILENHLIFSEIDQGKKTSIRRVFTFQGFFTAFLRRNLGIPKDRSETHRHHAMDAVILAISDYSLMKRIADKYKSKELHLHTGEKVVEPWKGFREDALARVYGDEIGVYKNNNKLAELYSDIVHNIKPLFISRAPNHKVTGAAHEASLLPPRELPDGVMLNQGRAVAKNDSMVRVDVFQKDNKYFYVPLYVADTTKKILPNKATTGADISKWIEMTSDYRFLFSIYPNDYIRIKDDGEITEGYYVKIHRTNCQISINPHDKLLKNSEGKTIHLTKVAKNVEYIKKYSVDIFGNLHEIKMEKRQPLCKHQKLPS